MPKQIDILSLQSLKENCEISDTGCWLWKHSVRGQRGYAQITDRVTGGPVRQVGGHVLSFFLSRGHRPIGIVLHSCHTPRCCNPDHVSDGTYSENNLQTWTVGGKKDTHEAYRKRMIEDKTGKYAAGRSIGTARGLLAMNGVDIEL